MANVYLELAQGGAQLIVGRCTEQTIAIPLVFQS